MRDLFAERRDRGLVVVMMLWGVRDVCICVLPMIWLKKSNKLHNLKSGEEIRLSIVFSFCLAHTYPLTLSPSCFPFLFPLADLRCLLSLCLCPELSILHCLMIDLQYSCPFPPHSPGQVPEWQQLQYIFTINPGVDFKFAFNGSCCQKKRSILLCPENIYLEEQNLFYDWKYKIGCCSCF